MDPDEDPNDGHEDVNSLLLDHRQSNEGTHNSNHLQNGTNSPRTGIALQSQGVTFRNRSSSSVASQQSTESSNGSITSLVCRINIGDLGTSLSNPNLRSTSNISTQCSQGMYLTALLNATRDNNLVKCQELIDEDCNINEPDNKSGEIPIYLAIKKGHVDILRLFLANNADIQVKGESPNALELAVIKNQIPCFNVLVEYPSLRTPSDIVQNDSILHKAANIDEFVPMVRAILNKKYVDINCVNKDQETPLHIAAQKGFFKTVKILLDHNADDGFQDNKGNTPLICASNKCFHRCCELLIKENVHLCNEDRDTALHCAARCGLKNTVGLLIKHNAIITQKNKAGNNAIFEACINNIKDDVVKYLFDNAKCSDDYIVTVLNNQNRTIIHCVSQNKSSSCLKYVLKNKKFKNIINEIDNEGNTALFIAVITNNTESAQILIANGASVNMINNKDETIIHLATENKNYELCDIILQKNNLLVNKQNKEKYTPLHLAANNGSVECCKVLLNNFAQLDSKDFKGHLPVHTAALAGNYDVCNCLIDEMVKGKVNLPFNDDNGNNPLHLAASMGHWKCCQMLFKKNINFQKESNKIKKWPIDVAFTENHDDVFGCLLENLIFTNTNSEDKKFYDRLQGYAHEALAKEHATKKRITVWHSLLRTDWWGAGFTGEHLRDNFEILIRKYPDVALTAMDLCMKNNEQHNYMEYNFKLFESNYYLPNDITRWPFDETTYKLLDGVKSHFYGPALIENHPLNVMVKHDSVDLLTHPLTKTWISHKWSAMFFVVFVLFIIRTGETIFLSLFMANLWNNDQVIQNLTVELNNKQCKDYYYQSTNESQNISLSVVQDDPSLTYLYNQTSNIIPWIYLVLIFGVFQMIHRVIIMLKFGYKIFQLQKCRSVISLVQLISTFIVIFPNVTSACDLYFGTRPVWQWESGVVALLITWLTYINFINQIPAMSIFVPITIEFVKSFSKVCFNIFLTLAAFALVFSILLFPDESFSPLPQSMVKIITWFLGDLGYDDTFMKPLISKVLANLIFVGFIAFTGAVIFNFIVCQPVDHLNRFKERAELMYCFSFMQLYLTLEACYPFFRKHTICYLKKKKKKETFQINLQKIKEFFNSTPENIENVNKPTNSEILLKSIENKMTYLDNHLKETIQYNCESAYEKAIDYLEIKQLKSLEIRLEAIENKLSDMNNAQTRSQKRKKNKKKKKKKKK